MTIELKFRKTTRNLIDEILDDASTNLEFCLSAGVYRDGGRLAKLNKDQLVHILNDARIKYPETKEQAITLARYIVQAEYQKRNGQVEKSAQTVQHLFDNMRLHNLKFIASQGDIDSLEAESENTMSEATTETTTKAATSAKAAKPAASKAAKKSSGKSAKGNKAGLAKAAEARKKAAAEKKTRLDNQVIHLKKTPSEDQMPLQARVICDVLSKNGRKLVASTLVAKLASGGLKSKQSPMAIWSFYRSRLIEEGFITVEDAR